MGTSSKLHGVKLTGRSRITNGTDLLPSIDKRSMWARRLRDLTALLSSDLGDIYALSEGQKALVRRASVLIVELERMDVRFADADGASVKQLEAYQRASNSLRRLLESMGIHRGRLAKDVTPPDLHDYLARKRRERIDDDVIDAEVV